MRTRIGSCLTVALLLGSAALAQDAPREVTGKLERNPWRIEGFRLDETAGLDGVLARAAEAEASLRVLVRPLAEPQDGLPLPRWRRGPEPARLVAVQGRLAADTQVGARALRADTPVWVMQGRREGDHDALRIRVGEETLAIDARLVHVGEDSLGRAIGETLAPAFGKTSEARHARTFHPDATVWRGEVISLAPELPWTGAAARLEGDAMVRMGPGLWKHRQMDWAPDLLSLAIRFKQRGAPLGTEVAAGDQDLFVSTNAERFTDFMNPLLPLVAPEHDYFVDNYYAAQPFVLEGTGKRVWVRLVPVGFRPDEHPRGQEAREAKLQAAVQAGQARFRIEVQEQAGAVTRFLGLDRDASSGLRIGNPVRGLFANEWVPLAELRLTAPLQLDQEAIRYHPNLAGRGLRPVGVVASIRPAVYAASQDARPETAEERARAESRGMTSALGH